MSHIPEQLQLIDLMIIWSRHWAGAANTSPRKHRVPWRHEAKTEEEERGRGWLAGWQAAESGTEEQSTGKIEVNTAGYQVFPDVQVLPSVFLLWQSDL